jgi:hypothetical protein
MDVFPLDPIAEVKRRHDAGLHTCPDCAAPTCPDCGAVVDADGKHPKAAKAKAPVEVPKTDTRGEPLDAIARMKLEQQRDGIR